MERWLGESLFNFRAGPAPISFHFCRTGWVVVWLSIRGEDSNAVPDADGTWQDSFPVSKSHFLFWIRVRRLWNWCPTILLPWENKSDNNPKTPTQHTDWSSHEAKRNVVWLIMNRLILSGGKEIDTLDKTQHPWSLPPDTHCSAKIVTLLHCWCVRTWTGDPGGCPLPGPDWILWVLRAFVVVHSSVWMLNWNGTWRFWRLGLVHFIMLKNRGHTSKWEI